MEQLSCEGSSGIQGSHGSLDISRRVEEEQVGPVGGPSPVSGPKDENRLGSTSSYVEKDEEFAYARTVSRLNHMQTADYLSAPWAPPGKAFIVHLESVRLQEGDLRRYTHLFPDEA